MASANKINRLGLEEVLVVQLQTIPAQVGHPFPTLLDM